VVLPSGTTVGQWVAPRRPWSSSPAVRHVRRQARPRISKGRQRAPPSGTLQACARGRAARSARARVLPQARCTR